MVTSKQLQTDLDAQRAARDLDSRAEHEMQMEVLVAKQAEEAIRPSILGFFSPITMGKKTLVID